MRNFLGEAFFGGACFVCRGAARELLCAACRAELPLLARELCPRCALPSPEGALCGRCLADPPAYDATIAALAYDFPADALVQALKFRGEVALAPLLGAQLRDRLPAGDPVDCVVPVPLSAARLRRRGYNQAGEIARHVAPAKLELDLCVRRRDGAPQMELPWAERQRNVRGAFDCRRALLGATVAVVDDVMTTGATLHEIARTLKRAGAERVVNWVVARTLPPD
jgi:ComF family protein